MKPLGVLLVMMTTLLLGCGKASENSTGTRGGGDVDAVAFLNYANQISSWLNSTYDKFEKKDVESFEKIARLLVEEMDREAGPTVVFVDENLRDGSGAPKMAIFNREPVTVWVNRTNWKELKLRERYELVALEVFGIMERADRYQVADMIRENFQEISGGLNNEDLPLRTVGGSIFYEFEKLQATTAYLYRMNAKFEIDAEPADLGGRYQGRYVDISGRDLEEFEYVRAQKYADLSQHFYRMSPAFQMDVVATQTLSYKTFPIDGGIEWYLTSSFRTISEAMSVPINDYLQFVDDRMGFFEAQSDQVSEGARAEIQKLRARLAESMKAFGGWKGPSGQPDSWEYITPHLRFNQHVLGRIRKILHDQKCRVLTTMVYFGNRSYQEKRVAELLSRPVPDPTADMADLAAEATAQTRKIEKDLIEVAKEWQALVDRERLDDVELEPLPSSHWKNNGTNLTSFINVARIYVERYDYTKWGSENEVEHLKEILSDLEYGDLCKRQVAADLSSVTGETAM